MREVVEKTIDIYLYMKVDKRSARMRSDSDRNMSALLTRITRQVSRMFDLNKIKMKTGSMAYVMEHRLYGLFFA